MEILQLQATTRVPDLVPIRYGRMSASPFAFYRGAAAVMAADLAEVDHTGLTVQLCGDAHLSNFGTFESPERRLIFDVNDFDETIPGPFEWDLKRLAASIEVAARDRGFECSTRRSMVAQASCSYRAAMRTFAVMRDLDIWYSVMDMPAIVDHWGADVSKRMIDSTTKFMARAQSKDQLAALAKLTTSVDGELRLVNNPPLMVPAEDIFTDTYSGQTVTNLKEALVGYRHSLPESRRRLLDRYEFVDLARKVVGVGSVGTRCWVALFTGRDDEDPLFLQVKEAEAAVGEAFLGRSEYRHHGQRVVEGQMLMQGASDILLGWDEFEGEDGITRHFYVRQLWDGKGSADIATMTREGLGVYGQVCGRVLAMAHARSGDAIAISSYLGKSDRFDRSLCDFAASYADQNERDYRAFTEAISEQRIPAVTDL
ncbi:MAG: DUF2252 domain-containing protein [Acidimicrobiales bacterium]